MPDKQCKQCGAAFVMKPAARVQKFCSGTCRNYWHFLTKEEKRIRQLHEADVRRKEKDKLKRRGIKSAKKALDEAEKIRGLIQTL